MCHFGDAPLLKDDSIRKEDPKLLNFGISKEFGNYTTGLDVLNLLGTNDDDVAFLFESQLSGELNPVSDIHFHSMRVQYST